MTTNERIHEHSFCYDADLPPSVPEGQPLRASCAGKAKKRRGLRRLMPAARAASKQDRG